MKRTKKYASRPKKTIASLTAMSVPPICWSSSGWRPQRRGACDVRVVERGGEECEQEPERAREDEGGEEIRGLAAGWEVPGLVLEDRPPEANADDHVAQVLQVEEKAVVEGGLVGEWDVPEGVRREPERQGDERARQRARDAGAARPTRDPGAEPEDEERGRPLREDDVLEEVGGDEVVDRDRGHGGGHCDEGEDEPGEEERRPEKRGAILPRCEDIGGAEPHQDGDLLPGRVPAGGGRRLSQQHRFRLTAMGLVSATSG